MTKGKKLKLTLNKIRTTRAPESLVAKSFRLHPDIVEAFDKQAIEEGLKQVFLFEKMVIFYLDNKEV